MQSKKSVFKSLIAVAVIAIPLVFCGEDASAQVIEDEAIDAALFGKDSMTVVPPVDSALINVSIFSLLQGKIIIKQDASIRNALASYTEQNKNKEKNGYRIFVFMSNSQGARSNSDAIAEALKENYPQMCIYRTYSNPYFKVLAGDFRTKADALKIYNEIKEKYPQARIIRSAIDWYQF